MSDSGSMDIQTIQEAYLLGRAEFKKWEQEQAKVMWEDWQNRQLVSMWDGLDEETKLAIKEQDPDAYNWINDEINALVRKEE